MQQHKGFRPFASAWRGVALGLGVLLAVPCAGDAAAQRSVVVSQGIDPRLLDPAHDTLVSTRSILTNLYDTLVWRDAKGNIVPSLAESWQFVNDTTLRLSLRRGVKFHDGSDFTAADVVFSANRYTDEKDKVPVGAYLRGLWKSIDRPDDHTVVINLTSPSATILGDLTRMPILPEKAFKALGAQHFASNAIGTGPFRLASWKRNEELVLEAFAQHFRGRLPIDRLVFKPIPEDFARYAALRTGAVDLISNLPPEREAEVTKLPALKVAKIPSVRNIHVGINMRIKPFDDVRVRQALNHAVDVNELIETVLEGQAFANANFCQLQVFGHDPSVKPRGFDPAKARRLLAEAGYPNGFKTNLLGPTGRYVKDREVLEAIAGQLSKVGIKATLVTPEWGEYLDQLYGDSAKNPEPFRGLYLIGIGGETLDCDRTFLQRGPRPDSRMKYWQSANVARLNELYVRQKAILDPPKRFEAFKEMETLIQQDVPWVFLYDQVDLYAMKATLDWQPRPDEFIWGFEIKLRN